MTIKKDAAFGDALLRGISEALAWKHGQLKLPVHDVDPMPVARIRAIRKAAAGSARAFEEKFAIPARTVEGWEQGRRKPDLTARILLTVIERNPAAVARALKRQPAGSGLVKAPASRNAQTKPATRRLRKKAPDAAVDQRDISTYRVI